MRINEILKYSKKPNLYEKCTSTMWTDEYISKQLLNIHLNPELDLGSRKRTTIESTAEWMLNQNKSKTLNILDLGCGPGLYSELFAKEGHNVTGVDFSKNSIEYAREKAKNKKLNIEYFNQNYLKLDLGKNMFDLIILIYTDFGVLLPNERDILLNLISKVLKPGGVFIFDVLNDKNIENKITPKNWELSEKGFWKNNPYLTFSESFLYEENKVILYQHIIMDEQDNFDVYRFWTHFFSHSDLTDMLIKHGFDQLSFHEDILPKGDLWNGENVTFCLTSKG